MLSAVHQTLVSKDTPLIKLPVKSTNKFDTSYSHTHKTASEEVTETVIIDYAHKKSNLTFSI